MDPIGSDQWLAQDSSIADCFGPIVESSLVVIVVLEDHRMMGSEEVLDAGAEEDMIAGRIDVDRVDHVAVGHIAADRRHVVVVVGSNCRRRLDSYRLGMSARVDWQRIGERLTFDRLLLLISLLLILFFVLVLVTHQIFEVIGKAFQTFEERHDPNIR